jgi:hypothetical protein
MTLPLEKEVSIRQNKSFLRMFDHSRNQSHALEALEMVNHAQPCFRASKGLRKVVLVFLNQQMEIRRMQKQEMS